jgi:hypothetical protein
MELVPRAAIGLVVAIAMAGCRCGSEPDRATPEQTLRGFFAAIRDGRIPDELEQFVRDDYELRSWRMRCEEYGCASVDLARLAVATVDEHRAVLRIDYVLRSPTGGQLMRGDDAPVTLIRADDGGWYIAQFGERVTLDDGGGTNRQTSSLRDAGPGSPRATTPPPATPPGPRDDDRE